MRSDRLQRRIEQYLTFSQIQQKAKKGAVLPKITNKKRERKLKPSIFTKEPYVIPRCDDITPKWFESEKPEVSIIVPLFRSKKEIIEQIQNWTQDGNVEIVYISDCCPQQSENDVLEQWTGKTNIGKVLRLNHNSGYATACNFGAKYAKGKYLIFLNADTIVTSNWIKPLISPLNEEIGLVGNLQLKSDGRIDSAGSEWIWDHKTFEHVGRNVFNGKRLSTSYTVQTAPEGMLVASERDMVTGCCFAMTKALFDEIEGFDIGYRIGYWEDSDINMKVKEKGYKVYFTPESVIYHKTGHSRAGLHPFIMDNAKRFYNKWVDNFKIDNLVKAKRCPK